MGARLLRRLKSALAPLDSPSSLHRLRQPALVQSQRPQNVAQARRPACVRWLKGFCAARMRDIRHFRLAAISFPGSQSDERLAEPPLTEPQRPLKRRTGAPTCLLRRLTCSLAARMRDIRYFHVTGAPTGLLRTLKSARALKPLQHQFSINLSLFNIIFN